MLGTNTGTEEAVIGREAGTKGLGDGVVQAKDVSLLEGGPEVVEALQVDLLVLLGPLLYVVSLRSPPVIRLVELGGSSTYRRLTSFQTNPT